MIVVRAPLRISFVGGGTDLPEFYRQYPGRVISSTIDKYVYVAINRTPFIDKVSARYSISETADHPSQLQHTRIRAALLDLGIHTQIEIASFASVPAKTGLGSSSSFSVALLKGLHAFKGIKMDKAAMAEAASRLEIELLEEPIGKQDQYAASFGGFNVFQFNADGSVTIEPILLDFKKRMDLERHLLIFFTGIPRYASRVLTEQRSNIDQKAQTLREMADSVPEFATRLLAGDVKGMGAMLHQGWLKKKSLASGISSTVIDKLYAAGMEHGAWGGKILGAGGDGCIMFLSEPERHSAIRSAVKRIAREMSLVEFRELPIAFVQSGTEIMLNGDSQ